VSAKFCNTTAQFKRNPFGVPIPGDSSRIVGKSYLIGIMEGLPVIREESKSGEQALNSHESMEQAKNAHANVRRPRTKSFSSIPQAN